MKMEAVQPREETYSEMLSDTFKEQLMVFILEQSIEMMGTDEFRDFQNYLSNKAKSE